MTADLFAGISVSDYAGALTWYEQLFGRPPSFHPNDREAVWEVDEHRYVWVEDRPAQAGHAMVMVYVDDLEAVVAGISQRGIEPAERETYENGVSKVIYRDADGNELSYGGA